MRPAAESEEAYKFSLAELNSHKLKHKHRDLDLKLKHSLLKPQSPTRLLLSKIILTSSNFFTSTKVISFIQLACFGAGCYIET